MTYYPDFERDQLAECPSCGGNTGQILDVRTHEGRRMTPTPVRVQSTTTKLRCDHCGHRWRSTTPWRTVEEPPFPAK